MISSERQKRVDELCAKIAAEKYPGKVASLAREVDELLANNVDSQARDVRDS